MSSLIVEVCRVDAVEKHPRADRMAIAKVKGWNTCIVHNPDTGESQFKAGDKCVYFPPDSVLPPELSDRLGVTKYLGALAKNEDGTRPPGGRVMVTNLRGEKSYGLIMACENPEWEVGQDVAGYYGVTKWKPPLKATNGDAESPHPAFHRYFDMEHIRNFPDLFEDGEEVVVTEKIHGQNTRLGLIRDTNERGEAVWKWMAGSHDIRRKRFWQKLHQERDENGQPVGQPVPVGDPQESVFWTCFDESNRNLLCALSNCGYTPEEIDNEPLVKDHDGQYNVVLFGERYGSGVQDMWYGFQNGRFGFLAFDVTLNGKYLDFDVKMEAFSRHGVEAVPIIYRGPYSFAKIDELAEGPTTVCPPDAAGKFKGREGVVVLPVKERPVVTEKKVFDRLQLKCVSFSYMARKDGTEFH